MKKVWSLLVVITLSSVLGCGGGLEQGSEKEAKESMDATMNMDTTATAPAGGTDASTTTTPAPTTP